MTYKNFEDYLQTKHSEQYIGLDDDMPDDYEHWLSNLDPQEFIDYADSYANEKASSIMGNRGGEKTKELHGKSHFSEAGKKGMAKRWGTKL